MVILQVAGAVAHGVAVFTEHKGAVLVLLFKEVCHALGVPVHSRYHVKDIGGRIVQPVGAFVVEQPCVVQRFYKLACRQHIFTPAAFISQRPEHNAGAVYIPLHKSFRTVGYGFLKLLVAGDKGNAVVWLGSVPLEIVIDLHAAVGLHIRFVDNVKAHLVAQLIKQGRVGIM